MTLTFRKAANQDEVTDPPVARNMNLKTDFVGTNYEHDLNVANEDITEQIYSFKVCNPMEVDGKWTKFTLLI